jgi:hypothetical protein
VDIYATIIPDLHREENDREKMGQPLDHPAMGDSMGYVETSYMQILDTPDSQSLIALMTKLDLQIQARFTRFHDQPIPAMQRWFNQPPHIVALETVDFKQQWIKLVDSAWAHHS